MGLSYSCDIIVVSVLSCGFSPFAIVSKKVHVFGDDDEYDDVVVVVVNTHYHIQKTCTSPSSS